MSAGRSAKRGSSRQYRLGDGKGPGRRTSTKLIATEVLPYQPTRLAVISRTKTEITREQELQSLKEEARDIEAWRHTFSVDCFCGVGDVCWLRDMP